MTDKKIDEYLKICFEKPWHIVDTLYIGEGEWSRRLFAIADGNGDECALKYVPAPASRREGIRREAETMMRLCDAEGLMHLKEFILLDDGDVCALLIRMEKCVSLAQIMDEEEIGPSDIQKILTDVMKGLFACHASGVAHRDIKPQNIFRDRKGDYLLGDFGISRVTDANATLTSTSRNTYTPLYSPPEVIKGYEVDWFRADVYAAGLVMYQLYQDGLLPYAPCGQDELIQRRCRGSEIPMPTYAPDAVAAVIWKCLQYEPSERYADAKEMAGDLSLAFGGAEPAALVDFLRCAAERAYAQGDYERARKIYEARIDHDWARRGMGLCLFYGAGVDRNVAKGVQLLQDSADSADPEAACCLGIYYFNSDGRDYSKAIRYFRIAAEAGNPEAQFRLGYCLTEGLGTEPDIEEAQAWFSKSAAQGHAGAKTCLIPTEKPWELFDWMPVDGGQALQITRCRRIDDGVVRFPEQVDGKNVVSLGPYLFVEDRPQSESTDHRPALYTQIREDVLRIVLPRHLREMDPRALYGCTKLQEIALAEGSGHFQIIDGLLYTADGRTLVKCPAAKQSIHIAEQTERIADAALFGCDRLTSVEVPPSVRVIGKAAFCGCAGLQTLTLPEGVEAIGSEAFTFCGSLKRIAFPKSVSKVGDHILSWRYGTRVECEKDSLMAMYVAEHCPYDPDEASTESALTLRDAIVRALVLLSVSYERHPDGVPLTSGSYRLVMQAREILRKTGEPGALSIVLKAFAARYPQHEGELKRYWGLEA